MIYDHRHYTCRPGAIQKQLALYGEHGYPVQRRHLGEPIVFGAVETGDLNSYVHIWAYQSVADREAKRAAMLADPDWRAYLEKSAAAGYLIGQRNMILSPAPFFEPPAS